MSKKLPHTLDTDSLIDLLKNPPVDAPQNEAKEGIFLITKEDDVLGFMATFNILPGEEKVKKNLFYSIYKSWSKDPVKKDEFLNKVTKFIETNRAYFLLNQNAVKLTYDVYLKFKDEHKLVKSKAKANNFQDFLKYYALNAGEYWLNAEIFYFLYDKYINDKGLHTRQLSKYQFELFCKLHFRSKLTVHGRVYGLSNNVVNFYQPNQLERMKATHLYEEEKPKKKKQKRKSRTPKSRSKVQSKD